MNRWDWIDLLIDIVLLILLGAVLAVIAAAVAIPIVLGRRIGEEIAIRRQGHRLACAAQPWTNDPDNHRKEKP